jgi:hypothetical protein
MVTSSELKKCPFCAEDIKAEAIVCRFCGHNLNSGESRASNFSAPASISPASKNSSLGFSIASYIFGVITICIGLYDLALIGNGTYTYILDIEIGILFFLSGTSLAFGITAKVKKERSGTGALVVSIFAVIIFLACASYSSAAL